MKSITLLTDDNQKIEFTDTCIYWESSKGITHTVSVPEFKALFKEPKKLRMVDLEKLISVLRQCVTTLEHMHSCATVDIHGECEGRLISETLKGVYGELRPWELFRAGKEQNR